jgi:DNA mismatch repair protein MutL
MEFVIREMASIPNPYACVHGRPTVMTITPAELDRKFKRTGF